jgi:hypothetical protein
MKSLLIGCALFALTTLTGCAGVKTEVRASPTSATLAGERTFGLARTPAQVTSADHARYETLVREELQKNGFVDASTERARYLVSLADDTRPAAVGVDVTGCENTTESCAKPDTSMSLFGRRLYQHALTLRFFERASGQEVYKVTATVSDRDADALHAVPYLVKSALAQLPYAGHPDWQVTFRNNEVSQAPGIVSVEPAKQ